MDLEKLFNKRRGQVKPGIASVNEALDVLRLRSVLNKPHVLVAGTNGKGTTSGFIYKLLGRAGLYTSPHIHSLCERYMLAEGMITESAVAQALRTIQHTLSAEQYAALSFFDVATLIALELFREQSVERFVLEVGMGGRLDSTNCSDPHLSVITSIALDHTEFLGDDLATIATEKAGVMRPNRPTVVGDGTSVPLAAKERICQIAKGPLFFAGDDFGISDNCFWIHTRQGELIYEQVVNVKSWPTYLQHNLSLAMMVCYLLENRVQAFTSSLDQLQAELPAFRGRMQRINYTSPRGVIHPCLIDVGHNEQGFECLVSHLLRTEETVSIAYTSMEDKPWQGVLRRLIDQGFEVMFFSTSHERSLACEEVAGKFVNIETFPNFSRLLDSWQKKNSSGTKTLVIAGSVMGMAPVFSTLRQGQRDS